MGTIRRSLYEQMEDARRAYFQMLALFLNEIDQVDEKTPYMESEPQWWLDMMQLKRVIKKRKGE